MVRIQKKSAKEEKKKVDTENSQSPAKHVAEKSKKSDQSKLIPEVNIGMVGQNPTLYSAVKKAFEIIEKKTNKNPIQILVKAIENSALFEEVAAYRVGGSMARKAVITAPQRRLDVALRLLTQGIYSSSFKSPVGLPDVIATELISAANNDAKSHGVRERVRMEKEAESAR